MSEKRLILVVEDERTISNFICRALTANDYKAMSATTGKEALSLFFSHRPDLVLLDLGLPDMDGLDVLKELSGQPFGVPELLARIRTTLRRADRINLSQGEQKDRYQVKDLVVDTARHQVFVGSEEIHFTQNEFKILELLCLHAGKVLTYDFILKHVWGPYEGSNNQILRVNMANIRRKLKENPSDPKYIHTELGIGYRMLDD